MTNLFLDILTIPFRVAWWFAKPLLFLLDLRIQQHITRKRFPDRSDRIK